MKYLANLTRPEGDPKILATGPSAVPGPDRLAKGLGWFSIGLGLTQLIAPQLLTCTLGLRGREGIMRVFGARQIASGMLTLSSEKQAGMTTRVVGDLIDLAALGAALGSQSRRRNNAGVALAMTAGLTLIDIAVRKALADTHGRSGRPRDYADRSGFPSKPHQSGQQKLDGPKSEDPSSQRPKVEDRTSEDRKHEDRKSEDHKHQGSKHEGSTHGGSGPDGPKPDSVRSETSTLGGSATASSSTGMKPSSGPSSAPSGHPSSSLPSGQGAAKTVGSADDAGPSGGPISLQEPPAATSR